MRSRAAFSHHRNAETLIGQWWCWRLVNYRRWITATCLVVHSGHGQGESRRLSWLVYVGIELMVWQQQSCWDLNCNQLHNQCYPDAPGKQRHLVQAIGGPSRDSFRVTNGSEDKENYEDATCNIKKDLLLLTADVSAAWRMRQSLP